MTHLFVIILNYKGKTDTEECIHSVLTSSYDNYKIVVVDNASKDGSADYFRHAFPNITVLETEKNLGYAGGNNVGIRHAFEHGADAVFVLNNDTILHADCLKHFCEAGGRYPNRVLGGRIYYYDEPEVLQPFAGIWDKRRGKFRNQPDATFRKEVVQDFDFLTGCALYIPRAILEKVGLFEESFFLYYEEIDWCFRARRAGFPCTYVPEPVLWHKESRSFKNPRPPRSYFQWRNRLLFMERNIAKSEFQWWLWTKLPKRMFFLWIKQWISRDKATYKASLRGIHDYFVRSFGPAPPSIFS